MKKNAFTLIELLLVIGMIGILVAMGIVAYSKTQKRARDNRRKSDLETIRSALEMYRADNGNYPDCGGWKRIDHDTPDACISALTSGGYLQTIPKDPKKTNNNNPGPCGGPTNYRYNLYTNSAFNNLKSYYIAAILEDDKNNNSKCEDVGVCAYCGSAVCNTGDFCYGKPNP